jgi:MFS family permease
LWLYVSVFVGSLGLGLHIYFVPVFAQRFGATYLDLGYIGTATALTYCFAPMLVGQLADRVNHSRLFAVAIVINFATTLTLAFSRSVSDIIMIRALAGLGLAFFWPITEVLVLQLAPRQRRVREIGVYSVAWGSAFLIGPLLGGLIIQDFGFFDLFVISSLLILAALLGAVIVASFGESRKEQRTIHIAEQLHVMRRLLPWYAMIVCYGIVFGTVTAIFPGYANSIGIDAVLIGVLFAGFGIARVVGYATSENYVHFGETKAIILASSFICVANVIIALVPAFYSFLLAIVILGGCFAIIFPLSISLISRHFPDAQAGAAVGSYESVYGIGSVIGPVLAGTLATLSGPSFSFMSASFFAILMILISAKAKAYSKT